MKPFITRLSVFLLLVAALPGRSILAQQPQQNPDPVKIIIEKNHGESHAEMIIDGSQPITVEELLKQQNLLNGSGTIQPGEEFEIIVRRRNPDGTTENTVIHSAPREEMEELHTGRGFLGVFFNPGEMEAGNKVTGIEPGSPAAAAGIQPGDVITKVNETAVTREMPLHEIIPSMKPGDRVKLTLSRNGAEVTTEATLAEKMESLESLEVITGGIPGTYGDFNEDYDGGMGYRENGDRARLGVSLGDGSTVQSTVPGSLAEQIGLQAGDVITNFNGTEVNTNEALIEAVSTVEPGDEVTVSWKRDGAPMSGQGTIGKWEDFNFEFEMPEMPELPELNGEDMDFYRKGRGCEIECISMNKKEMRKLEKELKKMGKSLEGMDFEENESLQREMEQLENLNIEIPELPSLPELPELEMMTTYTLHIWGEALTQEEAEMLTDKSGMDVPATSTLEPTAFVMYPNPTDGRFSVAMTAPGQGSLKVDIMDMNGKVVFTQSYADFSGAFAEEFDITQASKGQYVLRLSLGDKVYVRKFVTQ